MKDGLIASIGIFAVGSVIEQLFGIPNAPLFLFVAVGGFAFFAKCFAKT